MEKVYKSFYTKSESIVNYMIRMLSPEMGNKVFEPCAGDGVFVDELIKKIPDLSIDIYELNPEAVKLLKEKYKMRNNIKTTRGDTLTNRELIYFSKMGGAYDKVIANPPYGGWLDYEKRKYLKKIYPQLYVKETYTLFLFKCINLLKNKGKLVFIIPNTFLNLHVHKKLRGFILNNTKIIEICLFSSSFFPGVNFGYSNLAIITLQKCINREECQKNEFGVITGFKHVEELDNLEKLINEHHQRYLFRQGDVYDNIDHALFVSSKPKITYLINKCKMRIGDIANCVTGFYSGNDKKYLRAISNEVKNKKKYKVINKSQINSNYHSKEDILDGIKGQKHFIPVHKGGGIKYYKHNSWFMDWGVNALKDYKTNKKARFQNSKYYFKYGIGIPMVSSSQITSALIENKLFDQSIVGVFPKDKNLIYYLLAFFNSPTCNKLIRTINPSVNNPANYIKKIPFITPPEGELKIINKKVGDIIIALKEKKEFPQIYILLLNESIKKIYGF